MKNLATVFLLTAFIFGITSTRGYSQNDSNQNIDIVDYYSLNKSTYLKSNKDFNLDVIRKSSSVSSFDPVDQLWEQIPWQNEKINFAPGGALVDIGDINGDGLDDLAKRFFSIADERDSDISTVVNKSLVFLGGENLSLDHDQLFYTAIYPLGDMNGDGFSDAIGQGVDGEATLYTGSNSGLTELGSTKADTLLSVRQRSLFIRFGLNLNEDAFEDVFGYYRNQSDGTVVYFEVYGASSFEDVTINETVLPSETQTNPNNLYRFSINDTVHIGFNTINASVEYQFQTFKFVSSDSLALVDSKTINGRTRNSLVSDFDGDGQLDLILINFFNETYFYKGISDSTGIFSDSKLINNSFVNISNAYLLGDIMGDSKSEILYSETSGINVVNFDSSSSSFVSLRSVNSSNILFNSELFGFSTSAYSENSSVFNGFNTFSLPIQSDDKLGNVVFKIQEGSNDIDTELLLLNSSDYSRKSRNELFHLSDLENDGIDNFAIREIENGEDRLVLMNGLNDESPKVIENLDADKYTISHVQGGFFNDKEKGSVAVLFRPRIIQENQSQFRIYSIDDTETPYFSLQQTDLSPTLNRFDMFGNIGDINNDGFDDLALSAAFSNEPENIYIFLGGSSISNSPDITLNLNDEFPNPVSGQTTWGATVIQGLGDINGDGIDDFVLGDAFRYFTPELAQTNSQISGVMYLMYGQDTAVPSFVGPDFELQPDTSNTSNSQWIFGSLNSAASGDFDGDGIQDIVGISFRHANSEFDNGVGALTYFFGKDGFTNQPDTTIPIRTEYIFNSNQNIQEEYSRFTGRALLKAIPDINGDSADELLFVGNSGTRNAVLYEIGDSPTEIATAIYASPNKNLSLNPSGNFINKQYLPLVGDYNGDGNLNFLGYQNGDRNFRDTPVYMYEIDNMAVSIADERNSSPSDFELKQNYPNPFNPSTNISFSLPRSGNVEIVVYNILGQQVSKILDSKFSAGTHSIKFDASGLASGIYLYRIKSGDFASIKRMTLIK